MRTRMNSTLGPAVLFRVLVAVIAISLLVIVPSAPAAPAAVPLVAGTPVSPPADFTCAYDELENIRTCHLWARAGTIDLPTGDSVPIWGFAATVDATAPAADSGQIPGPVLIADAGETLNVMLHNDLPGDEMMSLVFPGQSGLVPDLEGIIPGDTKLYDLGSVQPGTFLYEAGLTPNGARQVAMGLYGALIVRPSAATFDDEAVLVLSEIDPQFNADPNNFPLHEYSPQFWLINGQAYPDTPAILSAAGNSVLLRYVNAGLNTHWMGTLGLGQQIIAANGKSLDLPRLVVAETVASGQTVDALVTIPNGTAPDTLYTLYDTNTLLHNASQRLPDGRLAYGGMMTFIQAGGGPPANEGPVVTSVAVIPNNTTGAAGVTLEATIEDLDMVTAAEYYTDTLDGPSVPMSVSAGTSVAVSKPIASTALDLLASGQHTFYVRGMDALGSWGAVGSAVLNLDKLGPDVTGLSLAPNPSNGSSDVDLAATGDDQDSGGNNVEAGQYSLDNGTTWVAMLLNLAGSPITAMEATLPAADVAGLGEGVHPVSVRAQDSLGTWTAVPATINLIQDWTGPDAQAVTLTPNALDFTPGAIPPLPTHVRLDASITDPLSNGVQSTVANAEGFIGPAGDPGTGFDVFPADGLFDTDTEAIYFDIPVASFGLLEPGTHPVTIRGLDAAGNWGSVGSADITVTGGGGVVDEVGPVINSVEVNPERVGTPGQVVVLLAAATDVDQLSTVAAGEWFKDADPGLGNGMPLDAEDGVFDSPSELLTVEITIDTETNWPRGWHTLSVRAKDSAGNWGAVDTVRLRINNIW